MTDLEESEDRAVDRRELKSIDDLLEELEIDGDGHERSEESVFPDCPRCGAPVMLVTGGGPTAHQAQPCGCRVHAPSTERK